MLTSAHLWSLLAPQTVKRSGWLKSSVLRHHSRRRRSDLTPTMLSRLGVRPLNVQRLADPSDECLLGVVFTIMDGWSSTNLGWPEACPLDF